MKGDYKKLWKVAQKIEGLICGTGVHAGGVIFVDEPFTNSTALMRAPDGTIITQFDLHDCEDVSLIKYDALSVEAMDKIHACLDLLLKDGLIEDKGSLKETYENTIGIYNLTRDSEDMWKMVWEHKILSLFQMEKQSGIQGIELTKPHSVDDLATLNSVIRLMAQEKGGEQPLNKYARFKNNIQLWYDEMRDYGLTKEEMKILEPIVKISYGICEAQERFMQLVQLPECGGFNLNWADQLRKSIAKKNPAAFLELEKEYFKNMKDKGLSEPLCNYVWNVLVATSRGYGFNLSHTLAYSFVALQEMNLAYHYPIIYWNCACLLSDSGSLEESDKGSDYEKIAKAIATMQTHGINISLVDINTSDYGFKPDAAHNRILYGLKPVGNINAENVEQIIAGRPYSSLKDFMDRCPLKTTAMINLIKAGAFDELVGGRMQAMRQYIAATADTKTKLTMQNFNGLIQNDLLSDSMKQYGKLFNFNKYLKAHNYKFDNVSMKYFSDNYADNLDDIDVIDGVPQIDKTFWDNIYKKEMEVPKAWLKDNQEELLNKLNGSAFNEKWNKYAEGTVSKWEMDSICCYHGPHELAEVDCNKYGIRPFKDITDREVERYWKRGTMNIPIYSLKRIIGTVIAKDDNRHSISLLTTESGVVNVVFTSEYYAKFKRQISQIQPDKTKKVIEGSWFTRGTKLMVQGYKRGDSFVAKSYSSSMFHQLYKIDEIVGNEIKIRHDRLTPENSVEEDYE